MPVRAARSEAEPVQFPDPPQPSRGSVWDRIELPPPKKKKARSGPSRVPVATVTSVSAPVTLSSLEIRPRMTGPAADNIVWPTVSTRIESGPTSPPLAGELGPT